jgi:hypothetical protein
MKTFRSLSLRETQMMGFGWWHAGSEGTLGA